MFVERSDKEAVRAAGLHDSVVYRQGLKHCVLSQRIRSDVLVKLIAAEEEQAVEHEAMADGHRHRAEEFKEKLKQITNFNP
jgi:hypothetical protein